ncbi:hypothetical protein BS78_05G139700 [Paspalum vaginatum]|nr:hypothetical protein BS78_05G139700 [Paspalum vaginatum]KAJ1275492.1 hypothetical protein BS78_05G139700 [Paspalum vaginatum]
MAEVGGMLASAILKLVTKQMGSIIGGQLKLWWDFSDDFRNMKMTLESLEAVLQDAETRSIQDAPVRLWLKRLTDAMYVISDLLSEIEDGTKTPGLKFAAMTPYLTVGSNILIANKMKKMRQELDNIKNQHEQFTFKTDSSSNVQPVPDERETDSYLEDQTLIVGRNEEKRKIIASLSESMKQDIIILPIYGIGGIGKTTLAKLIFNDSQFKDYSQVWIYVSQVFNLNKIGNGIISQLSKEEGNVTDRQMIRSRLGQLLIDANNKKIIIVLDDVWEDNDSHLNKLTAMLRVVKNGRVIVIVTTRDEGIARKICTVKPYKLLPLSDEMCWAIIKQKSDFEARDDKDHLEQVGKDIAMKCSGVALAAQSLGYMLKPLTFDEWESVRNNDIWNLSTSGQESLPHQNVLACLLLSYKNMQPSLKLCFAYCAFFPKGHKLAKHDLIYQWIANGFITPSSIFSTRQLGENYAKQLLGMSFLELSKSSSPIGLHSDDVTLFSMHDLVHDLARSIMADDVLDASKMGSAGGCNCRYALLTDSSSPLKQSVASPAKVRALRFLGYGAIGLHGAAFSSARYLRVLDLSECYIPKLPNCIGGLKQLRYLNAQGVQDQVIPICITRLSRLNYLNLRGSLITALPESISEMKYLMHLDLSSCLKIVELPKSFVDLKGLVHLDLNNCRKLDIKPELFLGLEELVYLDLSKCWCVKGTVEALGGLTKLKYMDLSGTLLGKKNLAGLQERMCNLTNLRYLGLSRMHCIVPSLQTVEMDIFIGHICSLTNLERLNLSDNRDMVSLPESIGNLRKLRILDLSSCYNLERLPGTMVKMDCLRVLKVEGCHNLDKVTLSGSKFDLLPNLMVQSGVGSKSNLMLQHASPDKRLKICGLESMEFAEVVHWLDRMRKIRIEKLELEWNRDDGRSVEDMNVLGKLLPPITLRYLELEGYNSVSFPAWIMSISQYLPNLVEIRMWGIPKCNSLPPMGQLPNLKELHIGRMESITKIEEGFYGGAGAFPQLWEFELRCMDGLEEWNTTYSDGEHGVQLVMSANLHRLTLRDCPKLTLKPCPPGANNWEIENCDNVLTSWEESTQPCASSSAALTDVCVKYSKAPLHQWRLLHHLPGLTSLRIEGCRDLTCSSQGIMRGFSTLQSLHLEDNDQPDLPLWLGEVTTLRELDIRGYPDLEAPLKTMKQLTSLCALWLFRCEGMTLLPRWIGELTSIEELIISQCPKLDNLQGSMQYLKSLQSLALDDCESLQSLPECFSSLTSLRRLDITDCRGIKSFPESIKKLPKLQHLYIG